MYHIFYIHSSVDGHLDCFHALTTLNSSIMNIWVHVCFWIRLLSRYLPSSGVAGYGNSILSFLRSLCTVFCGGCTNLTFPPTIGGFLKDKEHLSNSSCHHFPNSQTPSSVLHMNSRHVETGRRMLILLPYCQHISRVLFLKECLTIKQKC